MMEEVPAMMERGRIGRLLDGLERLLFPGRCLLCRAATRGGLPLCDGCRAELPANPDRCHRCAVPLPEAGLCGRCLHHPPPWSGAIVPFLYQPPLERLIQRYKFDGDLAVGRLLGLLLAEGVAAARGPGPERIVPMPLHPGRLRERGFNQSLELARYLSRRLGIPLERGLVRRIRATEVQSRLPAKARHANVRGAFAATGPCPVRHLAVVDDVLTTGASAAELTRVLRRAGAERVEIWTVARAGWG